MSSPSEDKSDVAIEETDDWGFAGGTIIHSSHWHDS